MSRPNITDRMLALAVRAAARMPAFVQIGLSGGRQLVVDGQKLDPQLQLILSFRAKLNSVPLSQMTPACARARFRNDMSVYARPRTTGPAIRDLTIPGAAGPLNARHYQLENGQHAPLLVFFHGGGFVIGDLDTHDEPCRMLCRYANTHVLSVGYRVAPENVFPAAIDDAVAAFIWARNNAALLGAAPQRVSIGGDSAGGTIAAVVSQLLRGSQHAPAAQLLIYPATDRRTPRPSQVLFDKMFLLSMDDRTWYYDHYLARSHEHDEDPRVSPLCVDDLSALPRALVVTAGFDVLRDEGEAYAVAMARAGTPTSLRRYDSLAHGFINITSICPAARQAVLEISERWRPLP